MDSLKMLKDMKVICVKCKKPVDSIMKHIDFDRMLIVYTAHCHGDTEEAILTRNLIEFSRNLTIKPGMAFVDRKQIEKQ